MDRKRRGYTDKKSAVMISLPSPFSKDDSSSYFNMKNINTVFGVKHARVALIFVVILFLAACVYLSFSPSNDDRFRIPKGKCPKLSFRPRDDVQVEPFRIDLKSQDWITKECFNGNPPTDVDNIFSSLHIWAQSMDSICRKLFNDFGSVYQVREKTAEVTLSETFMVKVKGWLKDNAELIEKTKKQTLVFVDNLYTQESVVFNSVRSRRPGASGGDSTDLLKDMLEKSAKDCDFCKFKEMTAQDSFGILESKHAAIVSNAFKIEKFHGMILLKQHDPSQFTLTQFLDAMSLASKWYDKVHSLVPDYNFRHMYWDVYPRASASQVHPHLHILLGNGEYYAKWNHLHISALRYPHRNYGANYWQVMVEAHHSIGLAVQFGDAVALGYITPQKDYCTFVISRKPGLDFFKMVYFVYKAFIEDLKLYAYSSGFVFPKMKTKPENEDKELPALFSIVYRGSLAGSRSDISSFDLFGTANVNSSPYKVIAAIRSSVEKRKDEKYEIDELGFQ
ncbi:uncharacterized protein LOC135692480 [Rhopilema esculentum]|uniref:uncharacterized protein LOC135692480 n=1 Tax=Rhopilema esculentum TaxID=499914 RepID=UPI0031DA0D16